MRTFGIISIAVGILTGCSGPKPEKILVNNDSITKVANSKQWTIDNYREYLNEVAGILDSINRKQKNIIVETKGRDINQSVIDKINLEIEGINSLLIKNRNKISSLNDKLKSANARYDTLLEAVITINRLLGEKESELLMLKSDLKGYHASFNDLQTNLAYLLVKTYLQNEAIHKEDEMLHTAYYAIGSEKELKENNVIDKKGGVLGINQVTQLKTDFNTNRFIKIDYYQFYNIPVNSKKAKLITNHPSYSYKWLKKDDMIVCLTITDPVEFWKASKYLVIIK